ncbi:MAG: glutamate dehydrogenase (NAD(P)+) [Parcubacteria group bacterium Gr01-1014_70]|nr:MAG: glutamate dehydrogenase (NAD(P)+) [Parcubacteria group bacterium Gr01-1014_70]
MTIKNAAGNIPFGGGKGFIAADPRLLSINERKRLWWKFIEEMRSILGPFQDRLAPDIRTTPFDMACIANAFSKLKPQDIPAAAVATGKPVEIPASIAPAVSAFQDFADRRGIRLHPDFIERAVTSQKNRYTGTVDALAEVDGKFGVLDIKTSTGFFREYNLQTAAYVLALQEPESRSVLTLPRDIETRWILRINQHRVCTKCKATLREKGGRNKVRNGRTKSCTKDAHEWGDVEGDVELREFPYYYGDIKAFLAAKTLWEWEHNYWLRQVGYL